MDFGDALKCGGPLPSEDLVEEEELFPPEMPLRTDANGQDTREMLLKLFQEEELDSDFVSEVKRVIGVKPESSLAEEVIVQLPIEESSTESHSPSTTLTSTTCIAPWKPRLVQ